MISYFNYKSIQLNCVCVWICSVLSRTLYLSNVAAHVHFEDLERILTPLGTLVKCEKIASSGNGGGSGSGGASTGSQEDLSVSQATPTTAAGAFQTIEVVFETPEEAEKYELDSFYCF